MKLLIKKLIFKRATGAAVLAATMVMALGFSSAEAAEYYRAIEIQKMQIKLSDGTRSDTASASKRKVDLTKSYTDISIAKITNDVNFLETSLEMSAQIGAGGIATVKVTMECQFYGVTNWKRTKTFTLAKDEQAESSGFCSDSTLFPLKADAIYRVANVQGSTKPVCPSKLNKGFVVSESKSSYHSDKLVFSSEAKLTKSTSSDCTYAGTLTQTWSTSQGSGSQSYEGSVTIPLSRF